MDQFFAALSVIGAFLSGHAAVIITVFGVVSEIIARLWPTAKPASWVLAVSGLVKKSIGVLQGLLGVLASLDQVLGSLVPQNTQPPAPPAA